MITPWGKADSQTKFAEGIVFYSTPSHGGFHVEPQLVKQIPESLRGLSGYSTTWYEEDCAWAAVAYTFPESFVPHMRDCADADEVKQSARETLERWYPDELAKAEGR